MKCKPYSEITVEIRTQLKTVKITSNIFAVCARLVNIYFDFCDLSYCSMARKCLRNTPWDNSVYVSRRSFTQLSSTLLNKTNTKTVGELSQLKIFSANCSLLTVEKKLELIFSKNVTKNVRKKSARKILIRGWIQIKSDFWRLPGVFHKIF